MWAGSNHTGGIEHPGQAAALLPSLRLPRMEPGRAGGDDVAVRHPPTHNPTHPASSRSRLLSKALFFTATDTVEALHCVRQRRAPPGLFAHRHSRFESKGLGSCDLAVWAVLALAFSVPGILQPSIISICVSFDAPLSDIKDIKGCVSGT